MNKNWIGLISILTLLGSASAGFAQTHEGASRWADATLAGLTLREKVAQMFTEQMRGEYVAEDAESYRYWSELVREGIGGFVVYGGAPYETAQLVNRLQKLAKVPILFSSDFEGGPGQQFAGASEFPANMALSAVGDEHLAYEVGKAGAVEGRAIGIHLTYSPVVDVQTRPDNPVLSVRSFGSDLDLLGRMAGAYIRGYQENGMLATAKHFPGRGDVDLIVADEYLLNPKPAARVEAEDLLAFRKAIEAGVTFVMSEHIEIPSVTGGSDLPASVEPKLATGWLRDKLGFEGLLTTDDLWYPKVGKRFGAERAGVLAILAGHDLLLKPANARAMLSTVVQAVETGEVPAERIDASVRKILYWKARLGLHEDRFVDTERIASLVGTKPHRDLVQEVAERSLTLLKNAGVFPTSADRLGNIVLLTLRKNEMDPVAPRAEARMKELLPVAASFSLGPETGPERYRAASSVARATDTVVVSLFHPRTVYQNHGVLPERDLDLLRSLVDARVRTIVLSFGNPYLAVEVPEVSAFVVGYGEGGFYGNQLVYADAFARLLRGEIEAQGKLPVNLPARDSERRSP